MDSVEQVELVQGEECIQDPSANPLLSLASDLDEIYGDPLALPRVGDQYQVEVPPLMAEMYSPELTNNPTGTKFPVDVECSIQISLPVPIMWVHVDHFKHEAMKPLSKTIDANKIGAIDSKSSKENQLDPKDSSNNLVGGLIAEDMPLPPQDLHPVPGSLGESWSDFEQECFLLGLYIFGKNLVQVKRFIENKEMGDILSFYYGKFYRSDSYRRWSDCRQVRSKKCVHGQRIFTGWRQQELLARLQPHISEEHRNTLMEIGKTLGEGKLSLEDYVTILKTTVGLNSLVEVVGVGKGKHDLTSTIMEPTKLNQVISARPEIPIGKACSSLSSADIIKFLTGDFRLSKARSNDIFWEAVWPRLLARGWHSEQPHSQGYTNSKNSLVFLVPGVKKFSRRKLVKGNHYFDSVSDVLSKVVSEPRLLELELEVVSGDQGTKEEYEQEQDAKLDQTSSNHQRHYLCPRALNANEELMKFTVVDTSLVHRERPNKVWELRSLPLDNMDTESPKNLSRETDSHASQEQVEVTYRNNRAVSNEVMFDENKLRNDKKYMLDRPHYDLSGYRSSHFEQTRMGGFGSRMGGFGSANALDYSNPGKNIKCQFNRVIKSDRQNYLAPVTKRRRLNACSKSDRIRCNNNTSSRVSDIKQEICLVSNETTRDTMDAEVGPSQQKMPSTSSGKGSPGEISEGVLSETELAHEKSKPRTMIDLNLPHVPPDFENGEAFLSEVCDNPNGSISKEGCILLEGNQQPRESMLMGTPYGMASEGPFNGNARRQSTRNRPLTTRALEALASGFLNTKRKGKGTKVLPQEKLKCKSSRPGVHDTVKLSSTSKDSATVGTVIMDSKVEWVDEVCGSNKNTDLGKSHFQTEGIHELHGVLKPVYRSTPFSIKDNISG